MLSLAFAILSAAVLLGAVLASMHLRGWRRPAWAVGATHGVLGLAGLLALWRALGGPPRGVLTGVSAFGSIAAWLAVIALLLGLGVLVAVRRGAPATGLVIAVHATVAVTAYVMLAAYVALG
jgi:hypothetical protein